MAPADVVVAEEQADRADAPRRGHCGRDRAAPSCSGTRVRALRDASTRQGVVQAGCVRMRYDHSMRGPNHRFLGCVERAWPRRLRSPCCGPSRTPAWPRWLVRARAGLRGDRRALPPRAAAPRPAHARRARAPRMCSSTPSWPLGGAPPRRRGARSEALAAPDRAQRGAQRAARRPRRLRRVARVDAGRPGTGGGARAPRDRARDAGRPRARCPSASARRCCASRFRAAPRRRSRRRSGSRRAPCDSSCTVRAPPCAPRRPRSRRCRGQLAGIRRRARASR